MPSQTTVMMGLLAAVGLILLYLLFLATRNPVIVKIGLRNIPRRPAQSVLIVIGLTLSTVIILSALSTGDTLTYSVRSHAIKAYGRIDEIIAPPILSTFAALGAGGDLGSGSGETNEDLDELNQLLEGGLTSVLTVLEGGLPGISEERYQSLSEEAAAEPLIDAVAASIIFPTIIRDVNSGQGEPLGFIFAVDSDYDQQFGLTSVDGRPVQMEDLQAGVGNIFAQAANLFGLVENAGSQLGFEGFRISDIALATAAIGAVLTAGEAGTEIDLAQIAIDLETLRGLGIDTSLLEEQGIESLSLESLGLNPERLSAMGVTTTTVGLNSLGIDSSAAQSVTNDLLSAVNLNTLGSEIDRVLAQAGLQLRQGDVYLNRLGAEQLDARVGDVLEIFIGPIPIPFRVRAIVDQAGPMGALAPVVMLRLDEAQNLLFMNGKVNVVLVSNQGNEMEGIEHTDAVSERLRVLALDPTSVAEVAAVLRRPHVKAIIDDEAAEVEERFGEEFDGPPFLRAFVENLAQVEEYQDNIRSLPMALEQVGVNDDLRFLLADNGVREWLVGLDLADADVADLQRSLSTLNQFDLLDPLSKSSVVTVAEIGGAVFTSAFSIFGILSILAGVLLIFLIFVMMAAERRSEMGMARAIGMQRTHLMQMFVTEGVVYDLLAAALGVILGITISYAMVGFLGRLFSDLSQQVSGQSSFFDIQFRAAPTSIVIAYCTGVLFTFAVVTIASWRVSRLNIVAAIRDLPEPERAGSGSWLRRLVRLLAGPVLAIAGAALILFVDSSALSIALTGISLILVGAALFAGWWLERTSLRTERIQRIVYSLIGGGLLIIWGLPWGRWTGVTAVGPQSEGPWVLLSFALTGPMIILGAILVIMFNADTWTWGISRLLGGISSLAPVLKIAVAYPLSSRFRTGMTMLLFAMIISTVTVMTIVIEATQTIVAPDEQRTAGFEISTSASLLSFFDPLEDLEKEIAEEPDFPVQDVDTIGSVATVQVDAQQVDADEADSNSWKWAALVGVNDGYLDQAEQVYTFELRAPGYDSDGAVWAALREGDDVAVVTKDLLARTASQAGVTVSVEVDGGPDEGRGPGRRHGRWMARQLRLTGVSENDDQLPEMWLSVRMSEGDDFPVQRLQVIGVIDQPSTLAGDGVHVHQRVLATLTGETVVPDNFYIKVREGADVQNVAQAVERALLPNATNATVLAESFAQGQAVTRGILQLLQGFLALGLLVGVAALGVISTRTVVERRQQVGMLRAIGFQSRMVALSFLLESSFIALTGILVGTAAGVVLGQNMVGRFFDILTDGRVFVTPWVQIAGIVLVAYAFALITTVLPAFQAARIYPAEALRYE